MYLINELGEILSADTVLNDGQEKKASDFTEQELLEKFSLRLVTDGYDQEIEVYSNRLINQVREKRDNLLTKTDWTQIPDAPLTKAQKDQYKRYRTALRDLPSKYDTITSIAEVTFPNLEDF